MVIYTGQTDLRNEGESSMCCNCDFAIKGDRSAIKCNPCFYKRSEADAKNLSR
jgi:hypothetical protein